MFRIHVGSSQLCSKARQAEASLCDCVKRTMASSGVNDSQVELDEKLQAAKVRSERGGNKVIDTPRNPDEHDRLRSAFGKSGQDDDYVHVNSDVQPIPIEWKWQEKIPEEFAAEQNSSGSASPPKMQSQPAARAAGSETLSSSPAATPAFASSPVKVNDSSGND